MVNGETTNTCYFHKVKRGWKHVLYSLWFRHKYCLETTDHLTPQIFIFNISYEWEEEECWSYICPSASDSQQAQLHVLSQWHQSIPGTTGEVGSSVYIAGERNGEIFSQWNEYSPLSTSWKCWFDGWMLYQQVAHFLNKFISLLSDTLTADNVTDSAKGGEIF